MPFFREVHEELTRSWRAPFTARNKSCSSSTLTTLDGGAALGYTGIPSVEAMQLCPKATSTLRGDPCLPSRCCKYSSGLTGSAYRACGEAASALHAMALPQVHQAKALKDLHEGGHDLTVLHELRAATDLALRATKVTAQSLGRAMSTLVVHERHLWLCLADMKEQEKVQFLNAPVSQTGLFGDAVESFAQQFSAAQKQTEAIKHIMRRRKPAASSPAAAPQPARHRGRPSAPVGSAGTVSQSLVSAPRSVSVAPANHQTQFQFARHPPNFRGVHFTSLKAVDAPVLCAEIAVLLAKDALEPVPPADMRSGFYSPYFIVPKKSGGLRPILDLRVLNRALHKLPFKMMMRKCIFGCVRTLDWFCSDRPEGRVLSSLDPPATQAIPAICVRGSGISVQGPALRAVPVTSCLYQSRGGGPCSLRERGVRILNYLDHWLILAQSHEQLCAHRDLVLRHLSQLGLRVNWERANSCQRRGSLFSAWSWIRSTRQHASPRNVLSRC